MPNPPRSLKFHRLAAASSVVVATVLVALVVWRAVQPPNVIFRYPTYPMSTNSEVQP